MEELVRSLLESNGFKYSYDDQRQTFVMLIGAENGSMYVHILPREDEAYIWVDAIWSSTLPKRAQVAVLPIINEINLHTKFTCMAFNPDTGEVSCHTGFNIDDSNLSERQLGLTMQIVMRTLDENIERIMRAAWKAPANYDGAWN